MGSIQPWMIVVVSMVTVVQSSPAHVVCYYTNWSAYRQGPAKFLPDNINPYLCTHLIYAFGGLTSDYNLKPFDKYQDLDKGGFQKFNGLKSYNKDLKTLLAIGGWNEGSARFSKLVSEESSRKEFIKNAIRFLRSNNFNGLDLDWEYPGSREGSDEQDKENYLKLIRELRQAFDKESHGDNRLLLTIAVPAGLEWIQRGYNIREINKHVDFFNMLTYDFHSSTEPSANHHAALASDSSAYGYETQLNVKYAVEYYLKEGASKSKLVIGIPTYGRSYSLYNGDSKEYGAASRGPGKKGKYTKEEGYLAYYEVCDSLKQNSTWTLHDSLNPARGPFATTPEDGGQWVGFDDPRIVSLKANYAREEGLAGIMFWSIDNDDFRGTCHGRPYPLIEAGKEGLLRGKRAEGLSTPKPPRTTSRATTKRPSKKKKKNRTTVTTAKPLTSTTPPPPTTPESVQEFECKDEGFYAHPTDCKKYFWCLDAPGLGLVAHHFTCPAGLYFNKLADSCDYARNVKCGRVTTTTTVATTTTTTTSTTEAPPEDEEEEEDDEEEEYYDEEDEEVKPPVSGISGGGDRKQLADLLQLIKSVGGVEELEKYLQKEEPPSSSSKDKVYTPINRFSAATTTAASTTTNRLKYGSIQRTTTKKPPSSSGSSTERSVVTRYTQDEVIVSDPYSIVKEESTTAAGEKKRYSSLERRRPSTTTRTTTPAPEEDEDDLVEYYEDEPEQEVTTARPRIRYTTTTTKKPTTQPPQRTTGRTTRRNLLLNRRRTTKRPDDDVDEVGVEESVQLSKIAEGAKRRRTTTTTPATTPRLKYDIVRTTKTDDLDFSSTTLNPLFQRGNRRRKTTAAPTTTTKRPASTKKPIAYANDYYYYYYDDDDEDQSRAASQSLPVKNSLQGQQLQRRTLEVEEEPLKEANPRAVSLPLSTKLKLHKNNYLECLDVGLFPHPTSCSFYVNCTAKGTRGLITHCPPGLVFDSIGRMCDWGDDCG